MRGMKQQRGVAVDADIPDAEKKCAGRLAVAFDAKQFAGLIVLADDRIEAGVSSAHLKAGVVARYRRRGKQQQQSSDDASYGALFLGLGGEQQWVTLGAAGVGGARRLGLGHILGEDRDHADAAAVRGQHDPVGLALAQAEFRFQNRDDELAWGVVVINEDHLVKARSFRFRSDLDVRLGSNVAHRGCLMVHWARPDAYPAQ